MTIHTFAGRRFGDSFQSSPQTIRAPMTRTPSHVILTALLWLASMPAGLAQDHADAPAPQASAPVQVVIDDVARFYRIYDAADGRPDAERLQRDYLDAGSEGLRHFAQRRRVTGVRIADTLAKRPQLYVEARRCMEVLPRAQARLARALQRLDELYPGANLPPVTIVVGPGKPVGIGYPDTGLQIGLEALCAVDWMNPDLEDRFVHVIAHEYAHVQLAPEISDLEQPTVLQRSLAEGAAEFVSELISGSVAYAHFGPIVRGREHEIETAFVADKDGTDLSRWLDNSSMEKPGDLGYWVGYRIVKAYYQRAPDKRRALAEILRMRDPEAFFAASGWQPGMTF